jgi:protein PET100
MGNWPLEVFKLGLYVTFPVGMFYFYNQASFFEDWVIRMKRELYPPESHTGRDEIQSVIKELRDKRQTEIIRQIQEEELKDSSG